MCVHSHLLQSSGALCDPMNCSLPGSTVQEILQARILEWIAMPSFRIFPTQGSDTSPALQVGEGSGDPLSCSYLEKQGGLQSTELQRVRHN